MGIEIVRRLDSTPFIAPHSSHCVWAGLSHVEDPLGHTVLPVENTLWGFYDNVTMSQQSSSEREGWDGNLTWLGRRPVSG